MNCRHAGLRAVSTPQGSRLDSYFTLLFAWMHLTPIGVRGQAIRQTPSSLPSSRNRRVRLGSRPKCANSKCGSPEIRSTRATDCRREWNRRWSSTCGFRDGWNMEARRVMGLPQTLTAAYDLGRPDLSIGIQFGLVHRQRGRLSSQDATRSACRSRYHRDTR